MAASLLLYIGLYNERDIVRWIPFKLMNPSLIGY